MITLKKALELNKNELEILNKDLAKKINDNKNLGAYIKQLKGIDILPLTNGIPIAIKDNINVKDENLTCSSDILKGYVSPYDATVIAKLRESNLIPFGRTNMDEFGMGSTSETSCYGVTKNPHDHQKVSGGSSSGSAAAVASGLAIAALGTDTGGSVRQPASFCGCVGMKPTYGRVSRYGIAAYASSFDQVGPITQNVEDAALLYDIISGYDPKDSTSAKDIEYKQVAPLLNKNKKLKIAVIDSFINDASKDIKDAYEKCTNLLEKDGHTIIHKNMMDVKKHLASYYVIATAEASANLARYDGIRYGNRQKANNLKDSYIKTRSLGFGKEVQKRIMLGTFVLSSGYYDAYYIKAQKVRNLIKEEYDRIFKNADLILSPVAPNTAYKIGSIKKSLDMFLEDIYTISVNLAGLPAISIPVGKDQNFMPIGLQFIAKSYDEQTLFDGALCLESLVNYNTEKGE